MHQVDAAIEEAAVDRLLDLPGLRIVRTASGLEVTGPAGSRQTYQTVPVRSISRAMVGALASRPARSLSEDTRDLIVGSVIGPSAADALRAADLEYADGVGNAYLNSPAAYVLVCGRRAPAHTRTSGGLTPADLKVLLAILTNPVALSRGYRELAPVAGVSVGAVSGAIKRLRSRGVIIGTRPRLKDFDAALSTFELGYADRLRPRLQPARMTTGSQSMDELRERIGKAFAQHPEAELALSGELGAAVAGADLVAAAATIHTSWPYRRLLAGLRLKPSVTGEVTLLRRIGPVDVSPVVGRPALANPILIRAELLVQGGERQLQAAHQLLELIPRP